MSVLVEADKWIEQPVRRIMLWQSTMMTALDDDGESRTNIARTHICFINAWTRVIDRPVFIRICVPALGSWLSAVFSYLKSIVICTGVFLHACLSGEAEDVFVCTCYINICRTYVLPRRPAKYISPKCLPLPKSHELSRTLLLLSLPSIVLSQTHHNIAPEACIGLLSPDPLLYTLTELSESHIQKEFMALLTV